MTKDNEVFVIMEQTDEDSYPVAVVSSKETAEQQKRDRKRVFYKNDYYYIKFDLKK